MRVTFDYDHFAVVQDPIENRWRSGYVGQKVGPLLERPIAGYDQAARLVRSRVRARGMRRMAGRPDLLARRARGVCLRTLMSARGTSFATDD